MRPFDPRLLRTAPAARPPGRRPGGRGRPPGDRHHRPGRRARRPRRGGRRGHLAAHAGPAGSRGLFAVRAVLGLDLRAGRGLGRGRGHRGPARARCVDRWLRRARRAPPRPPTARSPCAAQGAASVEPYAARFLPALVAGAVVPVLALATLFWVDWLSGLIVLLTLPLLPFFAALIGRATQAETEKQWSALAVAVRPLPRRHARPAHPRRLRPRRAAGRGRSARSASGTASRR